MPRLSSRDFFVSRVFFFPPVYPDITLSTRIFSRKSELTAPEATTGKSSDFQILDFRGISSHRAFPSLARSDFWHPKPNKMLNTAMMIENEPIFSSRFPPFLEKLKYQLK